MENKDLIFLDTKTEDSFVLVERNKKRQKEKQQRNLKRGVALILLLVLIFGAIKLFPKVKDFLMDQGQEPSGTDVIALPDTDDSDSNHDSSTTTDTSTSTEQSKDPTDTSTDAPPDKNEGANQNKDTSNNTSTDKSTENNEIILPDTNTDISTDTSVSKDTDTENYENEKTEDSISTNNGYKIKESGATKYTAINESGCEFDFSVKFSKTTIDEIRRKYGNDAPVVLITHSQKNETYSNGESYTQEGPFYNENNNVASLGKIICQRLNAYGIPAIQLNELYASGAILSSKKEYEKSLSETLSIYPSISYVFNISRGITINDDLTMNKSYTTQAGEKVAQISITSGTSWDTASKNQIENVRFAFDFAKFATKENSTYIKKNTISRYALSQNIDPLCANIDIGEFSNSFDEAKRSAELFATLFYKYISN